MKVIKYLIAVILVFGTYTNLLASDYPIIAIHGIQGNPVAEEGWKNWNNPYSAIRKILNKEYKGYKWGLTFSETLNFNVLIQHNYNLWQIARRIYNFSYYILQIYKRVL